MYWSILSKTRFYSAKGIGLADHEWDINEVFFCEGESIAALVKTGLAVVNAWRSQMKQLWPSVPFDIILSVDYGDNEIGPSVTLRFWAVRNCYHYIEPKKDELEKFKINAVLLGLVNYTL